jgi:ParG
MSRKTVAMKMPVKTSDPMEAWVGAAHNEAAPVLTVVPAAAQPMKRFTIDVPETLHKRVKMACAERGTKMADVIREMLEGEFPVKS